MLGHGARGSLQQIKRGVLVTNAGYTDRAGMQKQFVHTAHHIVDTIIKTLCASFSDFVSWFI
jgi:hypothetical protein